MKNFRFLLCTLLIAVSASGVCAGTAATPPVFASETSPVWHHIVFGATNDVLSDQGSGNDVAAATAQETDENMWNLVGTADAFYMVSKLGNYLAYDAVNNRYTTTAEKSGKVALTIIENIEGSWEIMRRGANKSMSQADGSVTDTSTGGDANQMIFIDLTPEVYDPAIFSSEESPVWYQVQFKAGSSYIADQGDGNNLRTEAIGSDDKQYWQFIGTPENFYMKSRSGNYVYYANNLFTTSSTEKTGLFVAQSTTNGYYEIGRVGSAKTFNQWGGAGTDKELGEWDAGNTNNPLQFIEEAVEIELPYFSTEEEPEYWWVYFNTSSATLKDLGAETNAQTAAKSYASEQLWQLVGDETNFYMKNKTGRYLYYNTTASRFQTTETTDNKTALQLNSLGDGNFEIQLYNTSGNNSMNPNGGAGTGKALGVWSSGDANNPVTFISAEPTYPLFSDGDNVYWYFIQFGNGGWVIEDKGAGNNVLTAATDDLNAQKWKLVGTKDNCQIVNKDGNYLIYSDSRVKTSTSQDTQGFKVVPTGNSSYPLYFEIQHASSTTTAFNMNGGAGSGKEIALYNSNDSGNPLQFISEESVEYPEFKVADSSPEPPAEELTLWYTQPATSTGVANTWMEYSLPIGNGQFGASLFGGVLKDQILFNDKTLWSGGPGQYGYYLPFGSVYIEDISGNFTFNATKPVQNYYRDLNLRTATGTVTYEDVNGVKYTKQYIASNPDKAVITRITASENGKLSFRITMESGKPTVDAETTYSNGYAQFTGKLETVSYNATLKVIAAGGFTSTGADGITVEEADEVLLVLVGSTDFVGNVESHVNGNAANLPGDNIAQADAVAEKGWETVYADHIADHQKFFNRVSLELDGVENNLPTNELITVYNAASGTRNLMLEQLYYNYGRYLSIASSRGADLPNNLQGIWNNTCTPPWHSDIHANINVQMNYWPVSAGNLDEMYEPFLNYIINEAAQPEWKGMASNAVTTLNNNLGTSTAVREDSWTCYTENNIFGGYSTFMTNYVIANAWYVTHLWQHYRYTLDKAYLEKAFPAMKGASLFWADRMVLNEDDGTYECPNEYSPEHGPGSENAVAHAQQIAWECIDNTIKAADVLGGVEAGIISPDDYDLLKNRLENMDKGLATEEYEAYGNWAAERNGVKEGDLILREWKYSRFYASSDQGHRHMSHLMALYPFGQLTPASEFFEPAINSMKLRGDESTGWSMGWKINLWARALMGDRSHAILRKALKHSTSYDTNQAAGGIYYNLYDSHAPFQIDGNFGATSGINEMLLQSHTDVIDILPALPTEWRKGNISGLKAVGDFTIGIQWENNQARYVSITNNQGQPCYVKCTGLEDAAITVNGIAYTLGEETTVNGLVCYRIESEAGDEIAIDLSNAIQADKSALEELIAKTEELIGQCYDYYATEATLSTTEGNDYYIWSNADHNDYNSSLDGGGIAALIDGQSGTYMHTNWNNSVTGITDNHFIEVNLGEDNAVSEFKFRYQARSGNGLGDYPKTIKVQGSNDGTEYTDIATVEPRNVNGGVIENGAEWLSGVLGNGNTYSRLRFTVTATTTNKTAGGYIFWHMAEFGLIPRNEEPEINYSGKIITETVETAQTEVEASAAALLATQTIAEYEATLTALQEAYNKLLEAITVTSPETGRYYRLKGKQSGNYIDAVNLYSGDQMGMKPEAEYDPAGTIFYLDENNRLLNYATGTYIYGTRHIGTVSTDEKNAWTFSRSEYNSDSWTLCSNSSSSKYLHDSGNRADRCSSLCGERHDFVIEEVTELPVDITTAGYASFYAPVEVSFSGIQAYYASEIDGNYVRMEKFENGIIPAGEGAILGGEIDGEGLIPAADEATYSFTINYSATENAIEGNLLSGTVEKSVITKEENKTYYVLGISNNVAGMYKPVNGEDTETFINAGHKAYMCITGITQSNGFRFGSGTTIVDEVQTEYEKTNTVYDLTGRKVDNPTKGIYIINGKKVLVQ